MKSTFLVPLNEIPDLQTQLDKLQQFKVLNVWRLFYIYYRKKLVERYGRAMRETPFAPSMHGRRKPKSKRLIPDGMFGVDSGALYADLTQNVRLRANELSVWTDLSYAEYVLAKFARKGPYAPDSILFTTEEDMLRLSKIIDDLIP